MTNRNRRGHAMTLIILTLFVTGLMSMMTIGIAVRIRENHELQNVADAAAFSQAVATARGMNQIAIQNRLQTAYWTKMISDQALLSYATLGRAIVRITYYALEGGAQEAGGCGTHIDAPVGDVVLPVSFASCNVDQVCNAWKAVRDRFKNDIEVTWDPDDEAAGTEIHNIQNAISASSGLANAIRESIETKAQTLSVADGVLDASGLKNNHVSLITGAIGAINKRELTSHLRTNAGELDRIMTQAAHAARQYAFVIRRTEEPPIKRELEAIAAPNLTVGFRQASPGVSLITSSTGKTWDSGPAPIGNNVLWAEDEHAAITEIAVGNPDCKMHLNETTFPTEITTFAKTTAEEDHSDSHDIMLNGVPIALVITDTANPPDIRHTVGRCSPIDHPEYCNTVWRYTTGFQPSSDASDAYGQPKVYVALSRDVGADISQPWKFNFIFNLSSGGSEFDSTGTRTVQTNTNLRHQTAIATGMTYFHRTNFSEGPTLMNPFWRATLVSAEVDQSGQQDVVSIVNSVNATEAQVYTALRNANFEGIH